MTETAPQPAEGLRQHLAEAMAKEAGSKAFRESGTAWDHARSEWLAHADAAVNALHRWETPKRLADVEDERDRARRWAVHLENENRRLVDQARTAKEQARVAVVAALNLQRQTPDAAQRALGRIRAARTWSAVWIELGQYFGLTAEQAGLEARSRRLGDSL